MMKSPLGERDINRREFMSHAGSVTAGLGVATVAIAANGMPPDPTTVARSLLAEWRAAQAIVDRVEDENGAVFVATGVCRPDGDSRMDAVVDALLVVERKIIAFVVAMLGDPDPAEESALVLVIDGWLFLVDGASSCTVIAPPGCALVLGDSGPRPPAGGRRRPPRSLYR